jgi:hypothetical protein
VGEMDMWLLLIYSATFFSGVVSGIVIYSKGFKTGIRSMMAAIDLSNSHPKKNNKSGFLT